MTAIVAALAASGLAAAVPAGAISNSAVAADGAYAFTAKINTDTQACSGVLVDPWWVLTASSCFPGNPQGGLPVKPATVTVGRTNLAGTSGHVLHATGLIPRGDRNAMLVHLDAPVTDIAPVPLATAVPAAGAKLRVAGFGRTSTTWVPDQLHTGAFTVASSTATTLALTGDNGADTCKGDAGGPAILETSGHLELVAISSTTWQHGCLAVNETRQGSTEVRVDDLKAWIDQQVTEQKTMVLTATVATRSVNLTWKPNAGQSYPSYRVYGATTPDVPLTPATLLKTVTTPKFTHGPLGAKQAWYYRVVPVTAGGQDGPLSTIASATTKWIAQSDYTADGRDDFAAAYYYGGEQSALLMWPATANPAGVDKFTQRWTNDGFDASACRWLHGDFNADNRTDVAAFCSYPDEVQTKLFVWYATADGFAYQGDQWDSGPGNFNAAQASWVAGDFNGDGRTDLAATYDYGDANTSLFVWYAKVGGFGGNEEKWNSGSGNFNAGQAQLIAGDFNGDGRADIGAAYHYNNDVLSASLFTWNGTATGLGTQTERFSTGGGFTADHTHWITGDFTGDGRTDVAAARDLGNDQTSLEIWNANATGFDNKVEKWNSGPGQFTASLAQWTVGDFDGDGRTDIGALYTYASDNHAAIHTWHAVPTGLDPKVIAWTGTPAELSASKTTLL
ncbi:trypsin-like serine protease [Amycolatopsis sp. NPDC059657]|uniref:trypsin-like serine protease n=1 Tax=Amycolatopsis sp. NPDC059657 TaxID=3346899 RepID=UPI0036728F40